MDWDQFHASQNLSQQRSLDRQNSLLAEQNAQLAEINRRQQLEDAKPDCPKCRGKISIGANVCMHCNTSLIWLPVAGEAKPFDPSCAKQTYSLAISELVRKINEVVPRISADLNHFSGFHSNRDFNVYMKKSPRESLLQLQQCYGHLAQMMKAAKNLGIDVSAYRNHLVKVQGIIEKAESQYTVLDNAVDNALAKIHHRNTTRSCIGLAVAGALMAGFVVVLTIIWFANADRREQEKKREMQDAYNNSFR